MSPSISFFHYSIFRGKIMQNFLNNLNPFSFYAQSMSHGSQKLKLFLLWLYINILYLGDNLQMEYTKCLLQAFNIQKEKVKTLRKKYKCGKNPRTHQQRNWRIQKRVVHHLKMIQKAYFGLCTRAASLCCSLNGNHICVTLKKKTVRLSRLVQKT